jgi:tetratricopeptide (TPR) repeat protein
MLCAMRTAFLTLALLACLARAEAQAPQHKVSPDELLRGAIDAQQRGDYEGAVHDYRDLLKLRPNEVEARVNLGAALVHLGEYDAAIAEYRKALPLLPEKNAVLMNLALAFYKKRDFVHAREQFESLHETQPTEIRIATLLGDTDLRLGDAPAAVQMLTPLEAGNSHNMDFEYVFGSALIQLGRQREGVSRMEKVAEAGNSADAYMLAGMTLLPLNEFEQARRDLDAALRLNPNLPGIYTLAGTARDKTGDTKEAESAFRSALKQNADDFDANLYLGAILYKRRELGEAKIYLDKALRLQPSSSLARYEMAMLKSASHNYDAAAQDLEALVKDDPHWLEPHVELASLYYRLHRPTDGAKERQIVEQLTAEQQAQGPGKP